jgi:hypothetical protein
MRKITSLVCAIVAMFLAAPVFATTTTTTTLPPALHALTSGPVNKASRVLKFEDTVKTSDNTETVCASFRAPVDGALAVDSTVVARQVSGANSEKATACICHNVASRLGGTLTADTASCACNDNGLTVTEDIVASGDYVQVTVTGPDNVDTVYTCYTSVSPVNAHSVVTTTSTTSTSTTSTTTTTL